MSAISKPRVWVWRDPEIKYTTDVISYVTNETKCEELVILHSVCSRVTKGKLIAEYVLQLCQTFELIDNERTTFLNFRDHLLALELCIANMNKNRDNEDLDKHIDASDYHDKYVAECLEVKLAIDSNERACIDLYNKFLKHTNCTNLWHLYALLKNAIEIKDSKLQNHVSNCTYLLLGHFDSSAYVSLMKLLCGGDDAFDVVLETPLNSSLGDALSPKLLISPNISETRITLDDTPLIYVSKNCGSASEEYVEDVMLSFLNLLVNSRNELSLSRAMTSPLVELSHAAFTDLKHVSIEKEMPMCQTVISYVTRFRLGGKGYAPPANCPLHCHIKGFSLFVDLLNQLQIILEEESSTELAAKKTINVLKKRLLKCKYASLREGSVEAVANSLIKTSLEKVEVLKSLPEKKSAQIGQESFDAINSLVNYRKCHQHCTQSRAVSQQSSHRTPLNLPPLMGYFRSPDEVACSEEESQSSLCTKEIINETTADSASSLSYFHSANSNSLQASCVSGKTPSKLSFKDCLKNKDSGGTPVSSTSGTNSGKPLSLNSERCKAVPKRRILDDISNRKKAKKPTKTKTKPQIQGQGKILTFFKKV